LTSAAWRGRASRAAQVLRTGGFSALASALRRRAGELRRQQTRRLKAASRRAVEFGIRARLLPLRIHHVYGPTRIEYGPDQVLLITVVRNGALFVDSFLKHYKALGIAHCVFLDNGSTDSTVEMLRGRPGVTVLQTDAPYAKYENTMKRYLANRFSAGRWNLCVDIDELFDYPCSRDLPLAGFIRYLNARGFTAVVAQMLDMFADVPLAHVQSTAGDQLKDKYVYYDTSAVQKTDYGWSRLSTPAIKMHRGGIRRTVFGTNNGLTKAPLVLMTGRVKPFVEWHQATGALVADVSCVLLHYPFVGSFAAKVEDAVRTGRYGATTTDEYVAYARALARDPALSLKRSTATRFGGLDPLIADGFLVVSDEYRQWVATFRA
jgi:hypothetical protein